MKINTHAFDIDLAPAVSGELDLFAEELSDESLASVSGGNCLGTTSSFGSGTGCLGTFGTYSCATKEQ